MQICLKKKTFGVVFCLLCTVQQQMQFVCKVSKNSLAELKKVFFGIVVH